MLLMSQNNPNGRKLEDLLQEVDQEIEGKNLKITVDSRAVSQRLLANNKRIQALLREAREIQMDSQRALATIAPDPGPLGKPRVGTGSDGMAADPSLIGGRTTR